MNNYLPQTTSQTSIYRLRPMNEMTLEELREPYLWFSLRVGFRDVVDANIGAFIEDTPCLLKGLQSIYTDEGVREFIKLMDNTGICCFTRTLPSSDYRNHYPNKKNNLCVEYDTQILSEYFQNSKYHISAPFHDVEYIDNPTIMETDGPYHILMQKNDDGCSFESIKSIFDDSKKLDGFLYRLLTRLKKEHAWQDETRMIIGGRNQKYLKEGERGYHIQIPPESISCVYLYENCSDDYENKLRELTGFDNKIISL